MPIGDRDRGRVTSGSVVVGAAERDRLALRGGGRLDKNQHQDPDSGETLHGAILRPLPNEPVTPA